MRLRAYGLILALVGCSLVPLTQAEEKNDSRKILGLKAPEIILTTADDQVVKLSEQKGKVVLIDIWATWCPYCVKNFPHIQELSQNKELAKQGLVVWAINSEEEKAKVKKFLDEKQYTFTVPLDIHKKMQNDFGIDEFPLAFIIGRDGKVQSVFPQINPEDWKYLDAEIQKALAVKVEK